MPGSRAVALSGRGWRRAAGCSVSEVLGDPEGVGTARAAAVPSGRDDLIRAEQVRLLYANLPAGLLAGLLSALVLVSVQWDVIRHAVLGTWFGTLVLVSLGRYLLARRYRRTVAAAAAGRWETRFAFATLLSGFVWGAVALYLMPDQVPHEVFAIVVLAGMTAGAVVSYSPVPRVALYFVAPALLPLTAYLFHAGGRLHIDMGMLSFVFMVMMLGLVHRLHETTLGSLRLRFENIDLVSVLAREKSATEDLNRDLMTEIGERARVEEGLRENEARLRAVVDNVLDGIITMDERGGLESMNPAAERMFGCTAGEVAGRHFRLLLPESERDEYEGYVESYAACGKPRMLGFGLEISGQRRDGSVFPMELAVRGVVLSRRRMLMAIVRDVTERRQIERMKSQFISTVSHELKTPLTALVGSLDLLAEGVGGDLSERGRSLLAIARNNSRRLARLIGDIIDLDAVQSGNLELDLQHVNLSEIVARAVGQAHSLAAASGATLRHVPAGGTVPVYADSARLVHVIDHLIANAVRFSPRGEMVEVSMEEVGGNARVAVTDRGPGVAASLRDGLFQAFAPWIEGSGRQPPGGAGLGLSIARVIVEAHGGSVGFEPMPGTGARFYFDLPQWHDLSPDSEAEGGD